MKTGNTIKSIIIISLVLFLAGCATLFSSSSDTITFISDPKGAEVYLNGDLLGKTPVTKEVEREFFKTMVIVIKKKGYKTKEFNLRNTLTTAAIFNLTSAPSWTTDAANGSMMEYDPQKYLVTLERTKDRAMNNRQHQQQRKALSYIALSFNQLKRDIAIGQGEYLTALAEVMPEHRKIKSGFIPAVNSNKQRLIESETPIELYDQLIAMSDPQS